jgi:hypothetical protein
MRHHPIRSRFAVLPLAALLSAGVALPGCLDDRSLMEGEQNVGSIGLELEAGGATLSSIGYSITGNGFSKSGNVNVSQSNTFQALIGGIPAGAGYTLTLSATDATDSRITCSATKTFNVTARATTLVVVRLRCTLPNGTGTVKIEGDTNVCPRIVGGTMALAAEVTDTDAFPAPVTYAWSTSGGGTLAGASSANAAFLCETEGTHTITLDVTDTDCVDTVSATVTCSASDGEPPPPPPPPLVKINEVESSGGTPGDWTELYNAGTTPADISGFVFKDNDDTHVYTLPFGTTIPAGGFYVVEEAAQGFGLGGADSVRLFDKAGAVVDSHTWTAHATTTYGRCPDGSGAFGTSTASSKGAANACAPVGPVTFDWPGANDVKTLDEAAQFTSNLSGLTYEPATSGTPAALWAVVNGPGTLLRLLKSGSVYLPDTANDWGAGKALRYPDGTGNPDSEGVTFGASLADGIYVATERNNDASTVSRLSVLRFDASASGATLTATHEWNLTATLPVVGANLGLEAITWVPDSFLVSKGFFDEAAGHTYNPSEYPNHGTGLFLVGIEGNGQIYAFALDHTSSTFTRIATFGSGNPGVMGLEFDRESNYLWASCDDTCANKSGILDIDTAAASATLGRFYVRRQFARPTTLPDSNNEGIAIAPESECVGGLKPFFWSDDNDSGGQSLRGDSIPCGSFLP